MLSTVQRSQGAAPAVENQYAGWLPQTTRSCAARSELIVGLGSDKELYPERVVNVSGETEATPPVLIIVNWLTRDLAILRSAAEKLADELRGQG
jgi:hypothetical protein